ncbi:Organellar oligopeptidase A, chloroplastic/mitochondrial [Seminavis robusta]|uniref:oligopeptidase A n=1 Tax=Seminavis robusta TaxID=568900 RepID=A0A9N8DCX7_9STRA|nr:Organellar oligopeptidase A, chloroplastic/mitochondrial [Seminavis robusta]|eukprot:Sro82_g043890.1 Organellar oligopeptidase A, chloroplastic/mitochondrial (751) ;mRNA; r:71973-74619
MIALSSALRARAFAAGNRFNRPALFTKLMSTATDVENPLLQQEDLPKFKSIEPKDLTPAVNTLLEKLDSDFDQFETTVAAANGAVKYDQVLPELERMQFGLGYVWGIAGHLNGVKNGEELRTAYEENQPRVVQAMTKFSQSKPLYDALETIQKEWTDEEADFEVSQKKRAVEGSLLAMKLGGVGLEGDTKEKFNEMKMKLAELSTKFSNNVLDATKSFSLTVEDTASMEGVPESAKAMWANAHVMYLKSQDAKDDIPEMNPEAGPWRITHDMPSYIAAMQHLPDRSLREQIYRAYISRAAESAEEHNNVPLVYEILRLKQEMSQMLGFQNQAERSLASKMAPSVKSVEELSDLIREKALPAAERELAEITAFAREHGGEEYTEDNLEKLMPWDTTFWSERLKESKFDLTEEELRPYFALPNVLDGMFGLLERIFGVTVQEAEGAAEVWNPDVKFFKVFDAETDKHIASFYLDPFSRPEDKRGGAWMDVCIGKSEAVKRDVPVAYLTCNGSPPVGDKPSLMTFREVETLFHETGHGLQHMLTKANVGDVAGINGVEWDAVELPSQFMENWCYDRPTVYGFAKHWETGEPLPEEMFEKLKEQKIYGAGMMACRQLLFGQLDMELHSNYDPVAGASGEGETIFDVHRRMAEKYTPYSQPLPEDRFLCTFGHIFAGGYSAGYYSYKWAEVMSADAFGAFEDVGLDNEEEVAKVGRKFRDTVLSLGGGVPPMEVFKRFRGREPSPEALLRHNGLA